MIDLILIVLLIVSLAKPGILLSKRVKERANDAQQAILAKDMRKIWAIAIGLFESVALMRYTTVVGGILAIICILLFVLIALPAIKETSKIMHELN